MGLSNNQQAGAVFISGLFIAVSIVSVPLGASPYVTFALGVLGAVGLYIKEYLGSSTANAITAGATGNNPVNAETVAQLKIAGDIVFANPNYAQGVVYRYLGVYYDVYGNSLGTSIPAGTGMQQ